MTAARSFPSFVVNKVRYNAYIRALQPVGGMAMKRAENQHTDGQQPARERASLQPRVSCGVDGNLDLPKASREAIDPRSAAVGGN